MLLDEWVPGARRLERDDALATLALRYFTGHGPATLQDYVWWSGLRVVDARAGLEMVAARLSREDVAGMSYWMAGAMPALDDVPRSAAHGDAPAGASAGVYLLPGFDEYLVGYRERAGLLDRRHGPLVVPGGGGMLLATIVADGRVVGTWRRTLKKDAVVVVASAFRSLSRPEARGFAAAAERYGRFLGLTAEPHLEKPTD